MQAVYSWEPTLAENIFNLATSTDGSKTFDIVHVEHLRGARYGVDFISRFVGGKPRLPVVWDSVDSISRLFRQAMVQSKNFLRRELTSLELGRTEHYERFLIQQFDRVLVTSENDKQALLALGAHLAKETQIDVLPNGVDLEYFTPPSDKKRGEQTVILSGKMSYHANISMVTGFVDDIMPLVWEKKPDVQVSIVGKDPPSQFRAYAQHKNIQVTGTVDDIRPYLREATISASPINYGVGIQNKVLEAMACATPVIASRQASSALKAENGKEIVIADGPLDFAEKLVSLLDQPVWRERIGKAGRRYVEKNHDWAGIAAQLAEVYTQTIDQRSISDGKRAHN